MTTVQCIMHGRTGCREKPRPDGTCSEIERGEEKLIHLDT
jgi:hypothetical protein